MNNLLEGAAPEGRVFISSCAIFIILLGNITGVLPLGLMNAIHIIHFLAIISMTVVLRYGVHDGIMKSLLPLSL